MGWLVKSSCGDIAVGGVGEFHGYTLIVSRSCLSYLSGSICLRMVLTLMILPGIPIIDSPVIASLPSQISLKNLGSIFGSALVVEIMYCIVSAISHSGALRSFCHLLW